MKLTDEEKSKKERGLLAKQFLESDFYKKYFYPFLEQETAKEFPTPNKKGWEEEYRAVWALAKAIRLILTTLQVWSDEAVALIKKEKEPKKDFMEA